MAFARLGAKLSWKVIASFPEVVSEPGGLHANVIGVNSKLACNHQERTNLFRLRQLWFVSRLVVVLRQSLINLLLPPLPAFYCAPVRYLKGTMVIGEMISLKGGFPAHWRQVKLFRWIYTLCIKAWVWWLLMLVLKCTGSMVFCYPWGGYTIRSAGYVG